MKESILKTCTIEELIVELQSRAGVVAGAETVCQNDGPGGRER